MSGERERRERERERVLRQRVQLCRELPGKLTERLAGQRAARKVEVEGEREKRRERESTTAECTTLQRAARQVAHDPRLGKRRG